MFDDLSVMAEDSVNVPLNQKIPATKARVVEVVEKPASIRLDPDINNDRRASYHP